ncbi:MAG: alpha/beta fold hydrolase [Geodermatophilaceae bacterium]|nr:alpha/beta fold hydrolase [Geodermatophilaceae bacterium]
MLTSRAPTGRTVTWACGTLPVPLDYDEPDGDQLELAVVRGTVQGPRDRIGSLVVNPGGPGASGNDLALNLAYALPLDVVRGFDIVGVDPRGVNLSDPVECISDAQTDAVFDAEPYARDDTEFAALVTLAEQVAGSCQDAYGDDLGAFNTTDSARDLEELRAALGDEQLTYLGYSYGTTLGSTYAEMYPERVRALVLDGAVDPTLGEMASARAQAGGFTDAFAAFTQACTDNAPCAAGPDPAATMTSALDAARRQPLPVEGSGRTVAVGLVFTGILGALYREENWPALALALGQATAGDGTGMAALADAYTGRRTNGTYPNRLESNYAVNCADTDEVFGDAEIRAFVAELRAQYPLFGAPIAANLLTCSHWRAPRTPLPVRDADGAAAILVVGTRNDPATPYSGAVAMARDLQSATLLTWDGEGHTAYPKTHCVTAAVDDYLLNLAMPDKLTCPAQ